MKNKEVLRKKYPGVPQEELVPFDKFNIFVDHGKYYTLDNKNKPVVLSNFILEPIAQIRNEELNESSYMYWIKNTQKERQLICLKAENLCRNNSFAALLLNHGYFVWKGTDRNLSNLFERLNEKIERCLEFNTLFWQEKYRVWAWGNGISTINGEFIPASETGIVHFNGKSFFIRACSNLIKDESSKLKNERHLNFSDKNPISTLDWSRLLLEAYGKKSLAGICFVLMSIFSDFLFAEERALPVLNLIGKPGSGKNEFAGSIISVLYNTSDLKPLSLANKTVSSLSDRLMLYRNGIAFLDEFRNVKEDELLLKDIYNRTPRSRSDMPGLKNPEIYATALVAGEHYPEQEALVTRIIPIKSEDTSWSELQTEAFNKLKQMEREPFSLILQEILQHRKAIETNFTAIKNSESKSLKDSLSDKQVPSRIINNYSILLAVFKILDQEGLKLAFTYDELRSYFLELIDEQMEALSNTGIVNNFWKTMEHMLASYNTVAMENIHSENLKEIKLLVTKQTDEHEKREAFSSGRDRYFTKSFLNSKQLIFITWRSLYTNYTISARRLGYEVISENNLKDYLRSSEAYIGKVNNYGARNLNADVFDSDKLNVTLSN